MRGQCGRDWQETEGARGGGSIGLGKWFATSGGTLGTAGAGTLPGDTPTDEEGPAASRTVMSAGCVCVKPAGTTARPLLTVTRGGGEGRSGSAGSSA